MPGTLEKYIAKFRKLRRAPGKKGSENSAPHKPVLLLAVIESFERGEISGNQVPLSEQLVITFKEVWRLLVKDTQFVPNIAMPFYHLKSEGFWTLETHPGMEESFREFAHTPTLSWLDRHILYALLPEDLAVLLATPADRAKLRHDLLETYFPKTRKDYRLKPALDQDETLETIELEILDLSAKDYAARMKVYLQEQKEIQIFLRNRSFQRLIPKAYEYRCAVTGWRVHNAPHAMIDACHIVPFAESQNDHITNGISLSPTLHRAFDRGLIAVDDDYRVLVRPGLVESGGAFSLGVFNGRKLHLPQLKQYYPAVENLQAHRERFGF